MKKYRFPLTWIPLTDSPKNLIGISSCPGKMYNKGSTKQLNNDLKSIKEQKINCLITLMTEKEIEKLGIKDFSKIVAAFGFTHYQEPIEDLSVPPDDKRRDLDLLLMNIIQKLDSKNVLIHCNAGLGRSGVIVGLLVKRLGVFKNPIKHIRSHRQGAIETIEQERYVRQF